jgi:hypothetical protein
MSIESAPSHIELAPSASALVESLRSIGYSLESAVADIIDNSITAKAQRVHIDIRWHKDSAHIRISDDGIGMTRSKLHECMRPGSQSPTEQRSPDDLGRFGLGLKTASFSQCRRLTVISKCEGLTSSATWDLDHIAKSNNWELILNPCPDSIGPPMEDWSSGTIVEWDNIDKLWHEDSNTKDQQIELNRRAVSIGEHISLTFHRFIDTKQRQHKLQVYVNGLRLAAFNPFDLSNPAASVDPKEVISYNGKKATIQSVTLPHHSKTTNDEWLRNGGRDGYFANQGFYVYRNDRLISHATWFGLMRKSEAVKLCRVMIDIENTGDSDWDIDVMKSRCHPPPVVRKRLRALIERLCLHSKRVYSRKGARLISKDALPLWKREKKQGFITYCINQEHPSIVALRVSLASDQAALLNSLLTSMADTLPLDQIHGDYSQSPTEFNQQTATLSDIEIMIRSSANQLVEQGGLDPSSALSVLLQSPLFSKHSAMVEDILGSLQTTDD